jgi:hypothetical protein
MLKSAGALKQAADSKHMQMYFTEASAQAAAEALGWSGSVTTSGGVTDLLAVSNAMATPGKANTALRKSTIYDVALRADRSADTTLVLSYANTGPFPLPLPSLFSDWLRVYRMPGTIFGAREATMTEFGLPAQVRSFALHRGESRVETLTAHVPNAVSAGAGAPEALRYRLRVVRQADLRDAPTTITVSPPAGWRVKSAAARFTASGTAIPVAVSGGRVRLAIPLQGDLEFDIVLAAS